jgi:hypothetical protein
MNKFNVKNYYSIIFLFILFSSVKLFGYSYSDHRWPKNSMPTFNVNLNGTPDCSGEFTAIQNALSTWNNVNTSYTNFSYGGTTSNNDVATQDGTNLICWLESGWDEEFPGASTAIAIASTLTDLGSNKAQEIQRSLKLQKRLLCFSLE